MLSCCKSAFFENEPSIIKFAGIIYAMMKSLLNNIALSNNCLL